MRGNRKDSSKIALNVDLHLALDRRQHDLIHERAQRVGDLDPLPLVFVLQGVVELLDPLAVLQCHARVQQGWRLVGFGQEQFKFLLAFLNRYHLRVERVSGPTLQNQIEKGLEFPIDLRNLCLGRRDLGAAFHAQPVHLLREDLAEMGEELRIDEFGTQCVQHTRFQLVAADVDPVVAGSLVAGRCTSDQRRRDRGIAATTAGTFGQPREEVFGAAAGIDPGEIGLAVLLPGDLVLLLPRLHRVPEIVIEDAQLRRFLDDPVLFRVGAGLPLAGLRILDEALAVPDNLADIHLVVEDAVAALRVAVDRAEPPVAA
ncbi:hypothetical protein IT40_00140 [Paracoccus versutus]|nr:hypothetical protein IT40_00140 [Paracoccus versutus]